MDRPFSYPVYGRMPDKTDRIHDNRKIRAFYFQISRIFYCTVLNQYPVYPFCRESNRGRGGGGWVQHEICRATSWHICKHFAWLIFLGIMRGKTKILFQAVSSEYPWSSLTKNYAMFLLTESQWRNHFWNVANIFARKQDNLIFSFHAIKVIVSEGAAKNVYKNSEKIILKIYKLAWHTF